MKTCLNVVFFLSLCSSSLSFAQNPARNFYLSPKSSFPSGQKNLKELINTKIRSENQYSYLVKGPVGKFWIPANQIIRDLNLSKWVYHFGYNKIFKVKEIKGEWVVVLDNANQEKVFSASDLTAYISDFGYAYIPFTCTLKKLPEFSSGTSGQLEAEQKVEILEFKSPWIKIQTLGPKATIGYILIQDAITKADLTSFVQTPKNQWRPVLGRRGFHLILDKSELLPLSSIKAWHTSSSQAILTKPYEELKLQAKTKVLIKKVEAKVWNISKLSDHGLVYWQETLGAANTPEIPLKGYWTTDQVLKKNIHTMAVHPLNPKMAVISAHGIFLTLNGETWKQIETFGNKDFPVDIGPEGQIFVGTYWSTDNGNSFTPFIKWEKLTKLIQAETKRSPQLIKIKSLSYTTDSRISLDIDTGRGEILLSGLPESSSPLDWSLTTQ